MLFCSLLRVHWQPCSEGLGKEPTRITPAYLRARKGKISNDINVVSPIMWTGDVANKSSSTTITIGLNLTHLHLVAEIHNKSSGHRIHGHPATTILDLEARNLVLEEECHHVGVRVGSQPQHEFRPRTRWIEILADHHHRLPENVTQIARF